MYSAFAGFFLMILRRVTGVFAIRVSRSISFVRRSRRARRTQFRRLSQSGTGGDDGDMELSRNGAVSRRAGTARSMLRARLAAAAEANERPCPGVRLRFESNASRPSKTPCILPVRSRHAAAPTLGPAYRAAPVKKPNTRVGSVRPRRGILGSVGTGFVRQSRKVPTGATCSSHEN
jgi:hypothetical protein